MFIGFTKYEYNNELGRGGFGSVHSYISKDNRKLAVKIGKKDSDIKGDMTVINLLNKKEACTDMFIHAVIKSNYIVMEQIFGTLEHYINEFDGDDIFIIFKTILNGVTCLRNELDLFYTDIKEDNIFIQCAGEKNGTIIIGDLGSAVLCNNIIVVRYGPPEIQKNHTNHPIKIVNEKHIVWGLGYILWYMIVDQTNLSENRKYFDRVHFDADKIKILVNELSNKFGLSNFLPHLLAIDPEKRWNLKEVMQNLYLLKNFKIDKNKKLKQEKRLFSTYTHPLISNRYGTNIT